MILILYNIVTKIPIILIWEVFFMKWPFKIKGNLINPNVFEEKIQFNDSMNPLSVNLISQILVINPKKRLGNGESDRNKIKERQYFNTVDLEKYLNKKIKPPFVPKI